MAMRGKHDRNPLLPIHNFFIQVKLAKLETPEARAMMTASKSKLLLFIKHSFVYQLLTFAQISLTPFFGIWWCMMADSRP